MIRVWDHATVVAMQNGVEALGHPLRLPAPLHRHQPLLRHRQDTQAPATPETVPPMHLHVDTHAMTNVIVVVVIRSLVVCQKTSASEHVILVGMPNGVEWRQLLPRLHRRHHRRYLQQSGPP